MLKSLQNKIATQGLSLYIRGLTGAVLWHGERRKKTIHPHDPNNIYTSIEGLPLNKFLDFYITSNYLALVKDENKPHDILEVVKESESIYLQYLDASGGDDIENYVSTTAKIAKLESRIARVNKTVENLRIHYTQALADTLKDMGIRVKVTSIDQLDSVLVDVKRFELDLYKLRQQQDKANKSESKQDIRQQYAMFDKILAKIDPKLTKYEIDTARFCSLYSDLKQRAKALEKHGRR